MDTIILSPASRNVNVGCLYNYYNAAILPGFRGIPSESVDLKFYNPLRKNETIATDVSEEAGLSFLGIKRHLSRQLHARKNDRTNGFWFSSCLKDGAFGGCNNNHEAQITAYLKFVRRTETLSDDFVISNIRKYCANDHGGTHLIDKVEYGAEFVLWMRKPINPSKETKESAEQALHLALIAYLDGIFDATSCSSMLNDEALNAVSCSFQSSIRNGYLRNEQFKQCCQLIQDLINIEENDRRNTWRPTRMRLRRIPTLLETEIANDVHADTVFDLDIMQQLIKQKSHQLIESPTLHRASFLKKTLVELQKLLKPIASEIKEIVDVLAGRYIPSNCRLSITKPYVNLLTGALNWLEQYHKDVEKFGIVLKENSLPVLDLRGIKEFVGDEDFKQTKVFVLHSNCLANNLEERFETWAMNPAKNPPVFMFERSHGNQWEKVYIDFWDEYLLSMGNSVDYVVGIMSPISSYSEGSVLTIGNEKSTLPLDLAIKMCSPDEENAKLRSNSVVEASLAANQSAQSSVENGQHQLPILSSIDTPKSTIFDYRTGSNTSPTSPAFAEGLKLLKVTEHDYAISVSSKCQSSVSMASTMKDENETKTDAKSTEKKCVSASSRNSKGLLFRSVEVCQLLKVGRPNIYLLKAQVSLTSDDLQWLEIGKPKEQINFLKSDHKVILLMGATGCGKSTLINGVVNYILGVCWADPFRFKIVLEEETSVRNQANSKTSLVTAYTIYHKPGMMVSFSITIIDIPEYGDTVERDKEITSTIHRFLTEQQDRVTEIHAACFVAASGDSRLTTTQRYIIDSMLSMFAKDMRDNIHLLVTFADNADPPVVQACLAANFPTNPAGIAYNKFNSSVLYADNSLPATDDLCFDEVVWDMGQENFEKFFSILSTMEGRSLVSTRQVIESRNAVTLSIEQIENDLDMVFVQMEKIECFRRQVVQYDKKMDNFTLQMMKKFSPQPFRRDCYSDEGMAYNCQPCKRTCEQPIVISEAKSRVDSESLCENCTRGCKGSDHAYQNFVWVYLYNVQLSPSVDDLKAEYDDNSKQKMSCEELLAKCNEDVELLRAKVLKQLDQVVTNMRILESTALRLNVLGAGDYLSMIKSRVGERQEPGDLIRLDTTLRHLQNMLQFSQT